jgi:hypothetical protein
MSHGTPPPNRTGPNRFFDSPRTPRRDRETGTRGLASRIVEEEEAGVLSPSRTMGRHFGDPLIDLYRTVYDYQLMDMVITLYSLEEQPRTDSDTEDEEDEETSRQETRNAPLDAFTGQVTDLGLDIRGLTNPIRLPPRKMSYEAVVSILGPNMAFHTARIKQLLTRLDLDPELPIHKIFNFTPHAPPPFDRLVGTLEMAELEAKISARLAGKSEAAEVDALTRMEDVTTEQMSDLVRAITRTVVHHYDGDDDVAKIIHIFLARVMHDDPHRTLAFMRHAFGRVRVR